MPQNFRGRNFITLLDYSSREINYLLILAENLKEKKRAGIKGDLLAGKNIALLFEKPSTRTRCSFVVAARDEGGMCEYLGKSDIQLGKKESVADTARVLGRMFDAIEFRGYQHETVEILADYAGVPVWNGLTDRYHPTQVLADLLTVKEEFGTFKDKKITYVGDGRNNVANSLMIGAARIGLNLTIVTPEELFPEKDLFEKCKEIARNKRAELEITTDPVVGVQSSDVIYTDVWVSMGEEDRFAERIGLLKPYQVNKEMIDNTGNEDVIFLHCLPAYHNRNTINSEKIYQRFGIEEMEVTDEVFEGKHSRVFDQAENRMHTIKAIMVATLGH